MIDTYRYGKCNVTYRFCEIPNTCEVMLSLFGHLARFDQTWWKCRAAPGPTGPTEIFQCSKAVWVIRSSIFERFVRCTILSTLICLRRCTSPSFQPEFHQNQNSLIRVSQPPNTDPSLQFTFYGLKPHPGIAFSGLNMVGKMHFECFWITQSEKSLWPALGPRVDVQCQ